MFRLRQENSYTTKRRLLKQEAVPIIVSKADTKSRFAIISNRWKQYAARRNKRFPTKSGVRVRPTGQGFPDRGERPAVQGERLNDQGRTKLLHDPCKSNKCTKLDNPEETAEKESRGLGALRSSGAHRQLPTLPINNGPYTPFGFESIEKQLWRNKQNDRPISDSEIKAVLSQLFKTDQWLPAAGHVSEDVTSHA
ncbi:hypothetical protein AVEN_97319-1 [Araneus ventricosus]|uniref:Uncharacterized protein n=1 Tax=Araneus ventricosus TaxID=182803 RepID=A0A4Y2N2T1_ARAVE|nr:hypothetical protein AVEN_97319-1 [Araneus ventricosus]